MYKFTSFRSFRIFAFLIMSLIFFKMVFILLKLTLNIVHDNIVILFIGGSGLIFIYESVIYIWIKNNSDILQTNLNVFYLILISENYNLTEIFLPFMYQSKEWESLTVEEQLKFYKAYLDKPAKRRGRAAEYNDIHTTFNDQNIGLMDSEYKKL